MSPLRTSFVWIVVEVGASVSVVVVVEEVVAKVVVVVDEVVGGV